MRQSTGAGDGAASAPRKSMMAGQRGAVLDEEECGRRRTGRAPRRGSPPPGTRCWPAGRCRRSGRRRRASGRRSVPAGPSCRARARAAKLVGQALGGRSRPLRACARRSGPPCRGGPGRHASSHRCRAARSGGSTRSSGSRRASSCSGKEAPPAPPADVQARTSRRTRSGWRIATSWATMPPKDTPMHEAVVPADGVEEHGGVGGEVGHGVRPGRHAALAEAALVTMDRTPARGPSAAGVASRRRCGASCRSPRSPGR